MLVNTFFLSISGYKILRVDPIWTYVQNFIVFSFHPLLTEILKKLKGIDNERNDTELHFNILYSAICDKFLDYD